MARVRRQMGIPGGTTEVVTAAIGDVDQLNVIDLVVPNDKAYVVSWSLTTKTAGATTGTFTATLKSGIENMLRHYIPEVLEVRAV